MPKPKGLAKIDVSDYWSVPVPRSEREMYWRMGQAMGLTGPMYLVLAGRNVIQRRIVLELRAPEVTDAKE